MSAVLMAAMDPSEQVARALSGAGRRMLLGFGVWSLWHLVIGQTAGRVVPQIIDGAMIVLTVTAFVQGYVALAAEAAPAPRVRRCLIGYAAAWGILLVLVPPHQSPDIHDYVNHGWMQAHYGLSPYTHTAADVPGWRDDPMFVRTGWMNAPSPYGFVFVAATKQLARLSGGDPWLALRLFKAANLVFLWATAWLVAAGCRRLGRGDGTLGLYLTLWNPLLLAHLIGNGHNDGWMGFLTLAAAWALVAGPALAVLPLLVLAGTVKLVALVTVPFVALYLVRRDGWRRTLAGAAAGVVVGLAVAWPWAGEWGAARDALSSATFISRSSLMALVVWPIIAVGSAHHTLRATTDWLTMLVKSLFGASFLWYYGWQWLRRLRETAEREAVLSDMAVVQFVLILVANPKYFAWYLGMLLPLVCWLPCRHWLYRAALVLTCSQMLTFTQLDKADGAIVLLASVLPLTWLFLGWPKLPRRPEWLLPES